LKAFPQRILDAAAATLTRRGMVKQAAAHPDSAAATIADLKADYNGLLAKLRAAGIVA
jgi:hypothetical protein